MNFEKKRSRQRGRQPSSESKREQAYRQGYFDGQAEVIERMINAGVLPPVNFDSSPKTTIGNQGASLVVDEY